MKKILFLFVINFYVFSFANDSLETYAQVKDKMFEISWSASLVQKDLRKNIDEQVGNYDVLNRLRQTKIKLDERRQRENITNAVKAADYGLTAMGIVTGGAALALKEGGKASLKWYFAKKAGTEIAKETAGVPGYSDSVKVGAYIYNKADDREIKGILSKEGVETLNRASSILETEGTSLKEKNSDIFKLILEMEEKIEQKDAYLKACVKRLEELKTEYQKLEKEAKKLKTEEEKKEKEKEIKAKNVKIEYKSDINENKETTPEIAVSYSNNESAEEKKAKIQKAITDYINSLNNKIYSLNEEIKILYSNIETPSGLRYDAQEGIQEYFVSIENLKTEAINTDSYSQAENTEKSAKYQEENLSKTLKALNERKNNIKEKIEPKIKEIAEKISLWKGTYSKYKPLGFFVAEPVDMEKLYSYDNCYINPLSYIETFTKGSEGFVSEFSSIEDLAKNRKNLIYTKVLDFANNYLAKTEELKTLIPQTENKINTLLEEAGKESEPINNLPHYFAMEFSYSGKKDLKDLKNIIDSDLKIYNSVVIKYQEVSLIYSELMSKISQVEELKQDPFYYEISHIAYSSNDDSQKDKMREIYKKIEDSSIQINIGTIEPEKMIETLRNIIFSAKEGVNYLESKKNEIISIYSKGISLFSSKSKMPLSSNKEEELNNISNKIFNEAEEVINEIRNKSFFQEEKPLLSSTGFSDNEINKKMEEFGKVKSDFWASSEGRELETYVINKEIQKNNDLKDPNLPLIRKMYEDFALAYQGKNVFKVSSYIDENWTSVDNVEKSDLEEHLKRIFNVFNEILFKISNLNISNDNNNIYSVSYDIEIKSKIYSKNIKREEKSSVYEKVKVENGKAKIIKTENGNYWYIK